MDQNQFIDLITVYYGGGVHVVEAPAFSTRPGAAVFFQLPNGIEGLGEAKNVITCEKDGVEYDFINRLHRTKPATKICNESWSRQESENA